MTRSGPHGQLVARRLPILRRPHARSQAVGLCQLSNARTRARAVVQRLQMVCDHDALAQACRGADVSGIHQDLATEIEARAARRKDGDVGPVIGEKAFHLIGQNGIARDVDAGFLWKFEEPADAVGHQSADPAAAMHAGH